MVASNILCNLNQNWIKQHMASSDISFPNLFFCSIWFLFNSLKKNNNNNKNLLIAAPFYKMAWPFIENKSALLGLHLKILGFHLQWADSVQILVGPARFKWSMLSPLPLSDCFRRFNSAGLTINTKANWIISIHNKFEVY